jgi:hypothetical protein
MRIVTCTVGALALAACAQGSDEPITPDNEVSETASASTAPVDPRTTEDDYSGPIPPPIKVGGDGPEMDACGTYAEVVEFDASGEDIPYVHDAPSAATKARDKLSTGQGVKVCETQNGFSGIVYTGESRSNADCNTDSPLATEQNYTGPCLSGWVDSRFLQLIAG